MNGAGWSEVLRSVCLFGKGCEKIKILFLFMGKTAIIYFSLFCAEMQSAMDGGTIMTRTTAREITMHLIYELEYHDELPEELLEAVFNDNYYPRLAEETELYQEKPNAKQMKYIEDCVRGVYVKRQELDDVVERYAVGWKITRISKVSLAVLRLAIYEILYVEDAPTGAVINEAVEIARRYEEEDKVAFINGILGSFARERE